MTVLDLRTETTTLEARVTVPIRPGVKVLAAGAARGGSARVPVVELAITGTAPNGVVTIPSWGATYIVSPSQILGGTFTSLQFILPVPTADSTTFRLISVADPVGDIYSWQYPDDTAAELNPFDGIPPFDTIGSPIFVMIEFVPFLQGSTWVWGTLNASSSDADLWAGVIGANTAASSAAASAVAALNTANAAMEAASEIVTPGMSRTLPFVAALHDGAAMDDGVANFLIPDPDGLVGAEGTLYAGKTIYRPAAGTVDGWDYGATPQTVIYLVNQAITGAYELFHMLNGVNIGPYLIETVIWNGNFVDQGTEYNAPDVKVTLAAGQEFTVSGGTTHRSTRWLLADNTMRGNAVPGRVEAKHIEGLDDEVSPLITSAIEAVVNGAPGSLDTLKEIADALGEDDDAIAAILVALAGKVGTGDSRLSDQRVPTNSSVTVAKINASGTPSASTYLRGDGSWSAPAGSTVRRRVLAASAISGSASGSPLWETGTATTAALAAGSLIGYRSDVDSEQTVNLAINVTATSLTSGQQVHLAAYALGTNSLPTGAPIWTVPITVGTTTGVLTTATAVTLPPAPFFVALLNPSTNAGAVTVTVSQPLGIHMAFSFALPTRPALIGPSSSTFPTVTTWTVDSAAAATRWGMTQYAPIVLAKA